MATSARNWKKKSLHELHLPSGNTCLVKRPGMEELLIAGVMPDSLTPMAMDAIKSAQSGPQDHLGKGGEKRDADGIDPEVMKAFLEKENALRDIFASFDMVTAFCVVEPKVAYHMRKKLKADGSVAQTVDGNDDMEIIPLEDRVSADVSEFLDDGTKNPQYSADPPLYTDEIDSDDKQEIFGFVTGTDSGVAKFPDAGNDVATSQHRADVQVPTV